MTPTFKQAHDLLHAIYKICRENGTLIDQDYEWHQLEEYVLCPELYLEAQRFTDMHTITEGLNDIRQDIKGLVRHLASSECNSKVGNRNRQRHSPLSGKKQWCVQAQNEDQRVWGPFKYEEEAWDFIHQEINHPNHKGEKFRWLSGSREERQACFETLGTYITLPFHQI